MKAQGISSRIFRTVSGGALAVCLLAHGLHLKAADTAEVSSITSARIPAYDLEIKNGFLIGKDGNATARSITATLGSVVELLRKQHPEVNFVLSPGLAAVSIADLKLRGATLEEELEALRIASGGQFVCNNQRQTAFDPTTGLPMPEKNAAPPMYFLTAAPNAAASATVQVEAFYLGGYFAQVARNVSQDQRAQQIDEKLSEIKQLIDETEEQYADIRDALGRSHTSPLRKPSVRYHSGASLLVIIGPAEPVRVAAKVVSALPGVRHAEGANPLGYSDALPTGDDGVKRTQPQTGAAGLRP